MKRLIKQNKTAADILRLGRKTWENMEWTKMAARVDKHKFASEVSSAIASVHNSL